MKSYLHKRLLCLRAILLLGGLGLEAVASTLAC